jgi:MFS family permease
MPAATLLPLLAKEQLGASKALLGVYCLASCFFYVICGLSASRIHRRIGFRGAIWVGGATLAATSLWTLMVHSAQALIGPCLLCGVSSGLIWPALEGANSENQTSEQIKRGISWFIVAWVTGNMTGTTLFGWLYEISPAIPFQVATAIGLFVVFLASFPRLFAHAPWPGQFTSHDDQHVSRETRKLFVRLAFLANFATWVAAACIRGLLPEYANAHGLTGLRYGILMSNMMVGFFVANALLTLWHGWHYSGRVFIAGQALGVLALLYFSFTDRYAGLLAAQFLFGAILGLTYFSSIYYGMEQGGSDTGHGGYHEAIIAAASGLGPFVGSGSMILFNWDRAAFATAALFITAVAFFQIHLMRRNQTGK